MFTPSPPSKKTPESICFGPSSHLFNLVLRGEKRYISTLNSQFSPMLCGMVIKSDEGFYIHYPETKISRLKMDDWKTILSLFWSKNTYVQMQTCELFSRSVLIRISTKKRVDDHPGYRRILPVFVHIVSHLGSLSPNQDVQVLTIEAWPPIEQCHLWRGSVFLFSFWCGIL